MSGIPTVPAKALRKSYLITPYAYNRHLLFHSEQRNRIFFQKPLILIREGKPGAARMTCHFRTNRNKNFLISNSVLSKQRNWGSRQTLARGQLNCLGGTAPQVRRGIEAALWGLDRGVPRPPRPRIASHLPAQQLAETTRGSRKQRCGVRKPFPARPDSRS